MADKIVALSKELNRASFKCGNSILDRYFHQQVSRDLKAKLCTCFVLCEDGQHLVKGYHTLSNASIPRELIPADISKKLPRYPQLPVTLLGRLAVDENFKGKGYGELLLLDALKKSREASKVAIGSMAVIVDPIDQAAEVFYRKYGFIHLPDSKKMFMAMKTIAELFEIQG